MLIDRTVNCIPLLLSGGAFLFIKYNLYMTTHATYGITNDENMGHFIMINLFYS
jgi:hypothetical protein